MAREGSSRKTYSCLLSIGGHMLLLDLFVDTYRKLIGTCSVSLVRVWLIYCSEVLVKMQSRLKSRNIVTFLKYSTKLQQSNSIQLELCYGTHGTILVTQEKKTQSNPSFTQISYSYSFPSDLGEILSSIRLLVVFIQHSVWGSSVARFSKMYVFRMESYCGAHTHKKVKLSQRNFFQVSLNVSLNVCLSVGRL